MGPPSSSRHHDINSQETQTLLPIDPEDQHDGYSSVHDICYPHAHLPVYSTIHKVRSLIIAAIDDPYSIEQLRDPRMNISVVRPLVDKLYESKDVSMVYCLLVNKSQFQKQQSEAHQQSVSTSRALLCELVANRILRRFHEDNPGAQGLLLLAQILVEGFDPFQGAPREVLGDNNHLSFTSQTRNGAKRRLPALEIAVISESKLFLSSAACQLVVNAIFEGRVIYSPNSWIDVLPDHHKKRAISLYYANHPKQPLFNQYRLVVPKWRNLIEVFQFLVLLTLYVSVMVSREPLQHRVYGIEMCFIVFTLGWILDQIATILEHGWNVYTQNLWSFLDVGFSSVFLVYFVLRIYSWRTEDLAWARLSTDFLALASVFLIPRLAFNLMSENVLFLSLRAMLRDFMILTALSVWCFIGFLISMTWLSSGGIGTVEISKWMIWIWFGLDGTGIQRSSEFHWFLGPMLMIAFAFLGNTLFLTILVSMLSTTFSNIDRNTAAERHFRRAVLTLEGVKSDAIFAFFPPTNLIAIFVLLPLKLVLTPRWFHKTNVVAVRVINAPLLLLIGLIERRTLWSGERRQRKIEKLPKPSSRAGLWNLSRGFSVHGDLQAVFDLEPPHSGDDAVSSGDSLGRHFIEENTFAREFGEATRKNKKDALKLRRDSVAHLATMPGLLRDLLQVDDHDNKNPEILNRLEALEEATGRIEEMLGRLCGGPDIGLRKNNSEDMEVMNEEAEEAGDVVD